MVQQQIFINPLNGFHESCKEPIPVNSSRYRHVLPLVWIVYRRAVFLGEILWPFSCNNLEFSPIWASGFIFSDMLKEIKLWNMHSNCKALFCTARGCNLWSTPGGTLLCMENLSAMNGKSTLSPFLLYWSKSRRYEARQILCTESYIPESSFFVFTFFNWNIIDI